ncbi:hypothetical protein SGPA1_21785 [Streptomyces misionensis JCM 4497]
MVVFGRPLRLGDRAARAGAPGSRQAVTLPLRGCQWPGVPGRRHGRRRCDTSASDGLSPRVTYLLRTPVDHMTNAFPCFGVHATWTSQG